MNRITKATFALMTIPLVAFCQNIDDVPEFELKNKSLPPYSIRKRKTAEEFTTFEFKDLKGKTWTNRNGLNRPLLILTGKWALRHDIKKWASYLSLKYNNFCDIIWVFNPDSTKFANHREKNEKVLNDFNIAVPVVIDNHALIGRSLKIEYDIPTIIGLTRSNRLGFVYESPLNNVAIEKIEKLIFIKLFCEY